MITQAYTGAAARLDIDWPSASAVPLSLQRIQRAASAFLKKHRVGRAPGRRTGKRYLSLAQLRAARVIQIADVY